MNFREIFKNSGTVLLWIVGLLAVFLIGTLLLGGAVWISDKVQPILQIVTSFAIIITVFILLPLSFIKKTRGFAAIGLLVLSYAFGLDLWTYSVLLSYQFWRFWGLCFGLLAGGIGVFPVAILASIFNGAWQELINLIFLFLCTFGLRILSYYLIAKHAETQDVQVAISE